MDGGEASEQTTRDWRPLMRELGWAAAAVASGLILGLYDFGRLPAIPAATAVVPVMALALVARPWVTVSAGVLSVGGVIAFYTVNGAVSWFTSTGRVVAAVLGVGVAGVMSAVRVSRDRDVREQARRAARLEADAQLGRWLALVTERTDTGAWEWRYGRKDVQSRGLSALLGLPADRDVTPELWRARMEPEEAADWQRSVRASVLYAAPLHHLHRVHLPDGAERWLEIRGEPLVGDSGRVEGIVGTAADVTVRVEEEQRRRALERLSSNVLRAGVDLAAAPDRRTLLVSAGRTAYDVFEVDAASVWSVDEDGVGHLVSRTPPPPEDMPQSVPITELVQSVPAVDALSTRIVRAHDVASRVRLVDGSPRVGIVAPVRAGGRTIAYLSLSWLEDRRDPEADWLAVVDQFAGQIALALSIVARREAEAEVASLAERLQRGLSATSVGQSPEWEVASLYRPGESRMRLGGDFVDTWCSESDGSMAFVLGDVAGHGPEQAALGVMLRSAWVGAASTGVRDPAQLAEVLRQLLEVRRTDPGVFATFVTGVIDVVAGAARIVCAGHPAPIVLCDKGARPLPVRTQLPAGVLEGQRFETEEVALAATEGLLLFSDGLFEGRDAANELGYDGLLELLRRRPPVGEPDLRRLMSDVERRHRVVEDDVAILLLRRRAPTRTIDRPDVRPAGRARAAGRAAR